MSEAPTWDYKGIEFNGPTIRFLVGTDSASVQRMSITFAFLDRSDVRFVGHRGSDVVIVDKAGREYNPTLHCEYDSHNACDVAWKISEWRMSDLRNPYFDYDAE